MNFLLCSLPKIINSSGLVCDIIGALLIWKYGLPDEISKSGETQVIEGDSDQEEIDKAARYERFARLGIGFLLFGFILQLFSNLVSN